MSSGAQTAPAIPDEEIVRVFQTTGSHDSFRELFDRHSKMVFSACRGFFADSAAAEDATQQTFLRVYERINTFQGGNFAAWVRQIAKNVCIDQWRRNRQEAAMDESHLPEAPAARAPYSSAEIRLLLEELWKEMRFLSPEQRACLELIMEGYTYEEIARRTGLPVNAVKSHVQNGRRMLFRKMGGAMPQLI
ncbi:MAG: RNA polymerase sigma factor [Terriglobia bacterium]|jgi:RNA polymerase sigma-70 factor (ECF subfamily)